MKRLGIYVLLSECSCIHMSFIQAIFLLIYLQGADLFSFFADNRYPPIDLDEVYKGIFNWQKPSVVFYANMLRHNNPVLLDFIPDLTLSDTEFTRGACLHPAVSLHGCFYDFFFPVFQR